MPKFSIRYNQDMKSFHWCDEKEVNPEAEGWKTVHTVTTEKAAQKYCDDNRIKLEAGELMDFQTEEATDSTESNDLPTDSTESTDPA